MSQILLVDDDIELCEMLVEYLGSEGFVIEVAHDGEIGVQKASSGNYDAVMLDVTVWGWLSLNVLLDYTAAKYLHAIAMAVVCVFSFSFQRKIN